MAKWKPIGKSEHKHIDLRCPRCGVRSDINKRGFVKQGNRNTKRGKIQRYACLRCDCRFIERTSSYRMKNPRWKILKTIELRKQGKTLAQIADAIGGVSRHSILRWLRERTIPQKIVKTKRFIKPYTSIKIKNGKKKKIKVIGHYRDFIIKIPK